MALDATARESNILDSLKKYIVDELKTSKGIEVMFDRDASAPDIRDVKSDRWVMFNMGNMLVEDMSYVSFDVVCCVRRDNDGFRLAQLREHVFEVFSASSVSAERTKRIDLYNSQTWTKIGGMIVSEIVESAKMEAPDHTKFKVLTITVVFASKV